MHSRHHPRGIYLPTSKPKSWKRSDTNFQLNLKLLFSISLAKINMYLYEIQSCFIDRVSKKINFDIFYFQFVVGVSGENAVRGSLSFVVWMKLPDLTETATRWSERRSLVRKVRTLFMIIIIWINCKKGGKLSNFQL